ncbi:glycosyltransferase family 2 protein [bacterium]|jgi:glycosyltransferase involved in cell wall biosynthesis|nr:glycosyltransferase family 2 protein [bacterium]
MNNDKTNLHKEIVEIIAPVYNEEKLINGFFDKVKSILDKVDIEWCITFINDGSTDETREKLDTLADLYSEVKAVHLSRNFGKEAALTAAFDLSSADAVIPMDVDLQDPPEILPKMINAWRDGSEIVTAVRKSRKDENLLRTFATNIFYKVFSRLAGFDVIKNAGDFRLFDKRIVSVIKNIREKRRFMKGIFSWIGFNNKIIYFDRPLRVDGSSKWGFLKLAGYAFSGLTDFSPFPLRVSTIMGVSISLLSLIYGVIIIIKTVIYGIDLPGYPSLMVAILFLGGVQLLFMGIIGEYLSKIQDEVKNRPIYIVDSISKKTN